MGTGEWQRKKSAGCGSRTGWLCQEPGIAVGMEALPHWVEVLIENFDDVTCRVPEWWVAWKKPADFKEGPEIPEGAEWKLFPTGLK